MSTILKKLSTLVERTHIPGLAVSVIRQGALAEQHVLGVRDTSSKSPVLDDTVFEAASLSKPVFAYAIIRLVDQEILDLDRPLFQYLHYEDIAHEKWSEMITARMVLSHKTGLVNWRKEKQLSFISSPGSQFSYSGEGYLYLQRVVENLTNLDLQKLVERELFNLLEMQDSSFIWRDSYEERIAVGHDANGKPQIKAKPLLGNSAYTLHTTAPDYIKFLLAVLQGEGLKKESFEGMFHPQSRISSSLAWGLGFGLQQYRNKDSFFQWGDNGCFKCFTIACLKEKSGIVYFTNSFNGLQIMRSMIALILQGNQPAVEWVDSL